MTIAFLLTTLVVCVTPGTGVVYTLSAALSQGSRAGVVAAFGCALGTLPHLLATVTGLAAVLHASALAFETLRYLGVAYLVYLAWATWRDRTALVVGGDARPRSTGRLIGSAILVNLLNPKLTIFFVAFLPQFVDPAAAGATLRMLQLGAVFTLVTFAVFVGYGVAAAAVRRQVLARPRVLIWVRRTFAGSFVALGAALATGGR